MRFELQVNIDCLDPGPMAAFWAGALGYVPGGQLGAFRSLVDPEGRGPKVVLQQVPDPTPGKNRLHLDLYTADRSGIAAEVARLVGLGATEVPGGWFELADEVWQVLADPEGNLFCVCANGGPGE